MAFEDYSTEGTGRASCDPEIPTQAQLTSQTGTPKPQTRNFDGCHTASRLDPSPGAVARVQSSKPTVEAARNWTLLKTSKA